MSYVEEDEEAFDTLLRRLARTPDVSGLCRDIGPGSVLLERFEIQRKLADGGMGRVFAALDRARQGRVALKTLGILTPSSIIAIKREFRVVAELVHPNLVRHHELFNDGPEWFFTMELLEGSTLKELRGNGGVLDVALVRHVFRQLAAALRALHAAGTLHGDLKPLNFLIVGEQHHVLLLDFGLARPLVGPTTPAIAFAGTPGYMAPEQRHGEPLTAAADWYAFGVALSEALAGGLVSAVLPEIELARARSELAALCSALLQHRPELRPDGASVSRALGDDGVGERPWSPPRSRNPAVVGRSLELAQLEAAYQVALSGRSSVVLVRGESGIGKTTLVQRFLSDLTARGANVLAGRCRERESMSYKAIDGLLEDLIARLDAIPSAECTALLPDGTAELTRLFPALRTARVITQGAPHRSEVTEQTVAKQRAIAAFRELLRMLAGCAPLAIWIDDLQWSDAHSAVLLEPLLASAGGVPLLFIGSFRSMGELRGPTLEALYGKASPLLPDPSIIELAPLSPSDAERVAFELLGDSAHARELAQDVAREAGGNPLFISELVQARTSPEPRARNGTTPTLAELMQGRVDALPFNARRLLETVAVAGVPLSYSAAQGACELTPEHTAQALDLLRLRRLARAHVGNDEQIVDADHDRVREIVTMNMHADVRRHLHSALARVLQSEQKASSELVAAHFSAAGEHEQAAPYWVKAADLAFDAMAFAHAAELYLRATEALRPDAPSSAALQVKRAEALAHAGRGLAAADVYLSVADAHPEGDAVELRRRAAEQLLLSGHLERGLQTIWLVLRALGMRNTRTGVQVIFSIVVGRLLVRLRGMRFRARSESQIPRAKLARVDASWSVACSLGVIDFMRGADFQNDHLLLALDAGEPRRVLRALTLEVTYTAAAGARALPRTRALLALCRKIAADADDPSARGLAHVSEGVAAYLQGSFGEALVCCQQGVRRLSPHAGSVWETVTAHRFIIASLFQLGRLGELATLVPPLVERAETSGNLYASTFLRSTYSNVAWLVGDDESTARDQLRQARTEWQTKGVQIPHCWMLVGDAHFALYTGDTERLWERFEHDWRRFRKAQLLRIGMLRVQLWHLRAVIALAEARARAAGPERSSAGSLFREARRAALRLGKEEIPLAAPLSRLVLAAVEHAAGQPEIALVHASQAAEAFDAQGMQLYAAASRARIGGVLGGDEGAALIAASRARFEAEGVVQFSKLLNVFAPSFSS